MDDRGSISTDVAFLTRLRRVAISVLPMAMIACFYMLVALHWWQELLSEVHSIASSESVATHLLVAAHGLSTAVFFTILTVITFTRKQPLRRERRLKGWALPIIVTALFGVVGSGSPSSLSFAMALVSTTLVVGGTIFTIYSLRFLGRHFGVVSDVRGLVTQGPYGWVRHPLYAGEAITLAGVALAIGTPLAVGAYIAGLALQVWRARTEEEALTSVFPEYDAYASRTPMLVPGLRLRRPAKASPAASGD